MLVITAFQRSGTTALGEQLGGAPKLAYWGEVFHPAGYRADETSAKLRLRPAANWFRFVEDGLPSAFRTGPQDEDAKREAWKAYTGRLMTSGSGRRPILDVKYNSWHHLESAWSPVGGRPFLMTLLEEQGAGFVHLVRRNTLAQALSEVFAHESGLWHRRFGRAAETENFRCAADTQGLLAQMRESRRAAEVVRRLLIGLPHVELIYETAYDARGDLSDEARRMLLALGVDAGPRSSGPVLGRTGQDPRDWLGNMDEVREALAGTEFEELLEPTLGPADHQGSA